MCPAVFTRRSVSFVLRVVCLLSGLVETTLKPPTKARDHPPLLVFFVLFCFVFVFCFFNIYIQWSAFLSSLHSTQRFRAVFPTTEIDSFHCSSSSGILAALKEQFELTRFVGLALRVVYELFQPSASNYLTGIEMCRLWLLEQFQSSFPPVGININTFKKIQLVMWEQFQSSCKYCQRIFRFNW